jgi:hypothetical protein
MMTRDQGAELFELLQDCALQGMCEGRQHKGRTVWTYGHGFLGAYEGVIAWLGLRGAAGIPQEEWDAAWARKRAEVLGVDDE